MANIALFVPRERMYEQAQQASKDEGVHLFLLKVVSTSEVLNAARFAVQSGADIIVARGMQAHLIKMHTSFPLVEIRYTGQELGVLVACAKKLSVKKRPTIACIGFDNLFSDMSYFGKLYNIKLLVHCVNHPDKISPAVEKVIAQGADVILGGEAAMFAASAHNVPGVFLEGTEESIREALRVAKTVAYAKDIEKLSSAQMESIMDITYNGIIQIDSSGQITAVNFFMQDVLEKKEDALLGKVLSQEIRGLQESQITEILTGKSERHSFSLRVSNTMLMASAAPIQYDSQIKGAIFTFYKIKTAGKKINSEAEQEPYLHGYRARRDFAQILRSDKTMQKNIGAARLYALSKSPVIIYGEEGTEKDIFAEAIHRNSTRFSGAFVVFECAGLSETLQMDLLFGQSNKWEAKDSKSALDAANYGTISINDVDALHLNVQCRLYKVLSNNGNQLDVRFIATSTKQLAVLVHKGLFSPQLYIALNNLSIEIAPIRHNAEEVKRLAASFVTSFAEQYPRPIRLSEGALKVIGGYFWPGNLAQLQGFCERLVLDSNKRTIEEGFTRNLLGHLYPQVLESGGEEKIVITQHPEAQKISQLLKTHRGNKSLVAKELGISATTLWRRIKKYGIELK